MMRRQLLLVSSRRNIDAVSGFSGMCNSRNPPTFALVRESISMQGQSLLIQFDRIDAPRSHSLHRPVMPL